tara:strand:+ start:1692 stop:2120 length:429 start_codon:yes stop_codon:yes gene_type:complete
MTTEVEVDQFLAPDGNDYLTIRSVVYDSWIIWQDAIPFDLELRLMLTQEIYDNIVELGTRVHKLHQSMPGYKALTESPFEFVLWFDPLDTDPDWSQGKKCRFMINEFTAEEIAYYNTLKKGNKLDIKPMTTRMVEAKIPVKN